MLRLVEIVVTSMHENVAAAKIEGLQRDSEVAHTQNITYGDNDIVVNYVATFDGEHFEACNLLRKSAD